MRGADRDANPLRAELERKLITHNLWTAVRARVVQAAQFEN